MSKRNIRIIEIPNRAFHAVKSGSCLEVQVPKEAADSDSNVYCLIPEDRQIYSTARQSIILISTVVVPKTEYFDSESQVLVFYNGYSVYFHSHSLPRDVRQQYKAFLSIP